MAKFRRRKPPAKGGTDLEGFLSHGGPRRRPAQKGQREKLTDLEVAMDDAGRRGRSGDWEDATGKTFVGMYALCFKMVYGEVPLPLTEKAEVMRGARIAMNCLHNHFSDDKDALVEYIKWSWSVERRKHTWALGQGFDRKPMGVGLQFAASLVQEHRIHLRSGRRRGR